jgi:hypothetical protein
MCCFVQGWPHFSGIIYGVVLQLALDCQWNHIARVQIFLCSKRDNKGMFEANVVLLVILKS